MGRQSGGSGLCRVLGPLPKRERGARRLFALRRDRDLADATVAVAIEAHQTVAEERPKVAGQRCPLEPQKRREPRRGRWTGEDQRRQKVELGDANAGFAQRVVEGAGQFTTRAPRPSAGAIAAERKVDSDP